MKLDIEAIERRAAAVLGARSGWSEAERDRAALLAAHADLVAALDRLETAAFWSNGSLLDEDAQGALKQARAALLRARGGVA